METNESLNELWERYLTDKGADFVRFVDAGALPCEAAEGYKCAIVFGKALSREYVRAMRDGTAPKTKEAINTERKMDVLAVKTAELLEAEGYRSIGKLKNGLIPHKTAALRAGLGFIGKNNLLVTERFGCALLLGKVLTDAPFVTESVEPMEPKCGDCGVCADVCPTGALHGTQWKLGITREEIIDRKQCVLCLKCMVCCPYTERYMKEADV